MRLRYKVIRRGPYKYIHWIHHAGKNELYDLSKDPYELNNIANDPEQWDRVKQLRQELGELVSTTIGL